MTGLTPTFSAQSLNASEFLNAISFSDELRIPTGPELEAAFLELVRLFPNDVKLSVPGISQGGRRVLCANIGRGPAVVAVTGGAHADEPVGSLTCLELAKALLGNHALRDLLSTHTFVIHPMLDPDGAAANEAWSTKHFAYRDFLLYGVRNALPAEDLEHGIPVAPEQKARPEVATFLLNTAGLNGRLVRYVTLHTTHRLGGSLFVVTCDDFPSDLRAGLSALCDSEGIPVTCFDPRGEDGIGFLLPGFLRAPRVSDFALRFAERPEVLAQIKMSTYEYAESRLGANCSLIAELPSVIDRRLEDSTAGTRTLLMHKKAMHENLIASAFHWQETVSILERWNLQDDNFWLKQARFKLASRLAKKPFDEGAEAPACAGLLSRVYEDVDAAEGLLLEELEAAKYVHQALAENGSAQADREAALRRFDTCYDRLFGGVVLENVPIATQVRVQLGMVLTGLGSFDV